MNKSVLFGLLSILLTLLAGPPSAAADRWTGPAGPSLVRIENSRAGTADWELRNPATAGEIQGYADKTSVNRGERLILYVDTDAPSYRIDIFRMGYYGGKGARLVRSINRIAGLSQPKPCLNGDGIIDCNWKSGVEITVPANGAWRSGVYLARLSTEEDVVKDSYVIFVIRDDSRRPDFLFQLPVTTYQAYNRWGGKSLYVGCDETLKHCSVDDRADHVSFNRPYAASPNAKAAFGVGAGEFITNVQPASDDYPISTAGFDLNLVRWIERQGYDVGYVSNLDLEERPELLARSRAFISSGHDEYYSHDMYQSLTAAADNGLNIGFFSANQIYWQVRFSDSGAMGQNRIMTCYRRGGDPVTENTRTTGRFRELGRPEAALIGNQYSFDPVDSYISIKDPDHWLMAGTGASMGMRFDGLLGYEVNSVDPAHSPADVSVLAHTDNGDWKSDVTFYNRASGAQVFSTGTMQWSWGLDDFISNATRKPHAHPVIQKLTANVFAALGDRNLFTISDPSGSYRLDVLAGEPGVKTLRRAAGIRRVTSPSLWHFAMVTEPEAHPGTARIVSRSTGRCLTRNVAAPAVRLARCDQSDDQNWLVDLTDPAPTPIRSSNLSSCLARDPVSHGLTLAPCADSTGWKIRTARLLRSDRKG